MSNIILYTIGCPQCKVLEKKLIQSGLEYEVVTDKDEIIKKGFRTAPILEVDGKAMTFKDAVDYVNRAINGNFHQ